MKLTLVEDLDILSTYFEIKHPKYVWDTKTLIIAFLKITELAANRKHLFYNGAERT